MGLETYLYLKGMTLWKEIEKPNKWKLLSESTITLTFFREGWFDELLLCGVETIWHAGRSQDISYGQSVSRSEWGSSLH